MRPNLAMRKDQVIMHTSSFALVWDYIGNRHYTWDLTNVSKRYDLVSLFVSECMPWLRRNLPGFPLP